MLLNELRIKILEEFLGDYQGLFTGSLIARKNNLNQKSVANVLNEMENEGFLKSKTSGKNKEFSLNLENRDTVKNMIIAAEHLRTAEFLRMHAMVKEVLFKIKSAYDGIAIIFGSYAKGTEKKDSDLDIFVVGTVDRKKVRSVSELYNIEVNVKNYSPTEFKRALKKKDILLTEVIKNHMIIAGTEEFIDAVLREYYGND